MVRMVSTCAGPLVSGLFYQPLHILVFPIYQFRCARTLCSGVGVPKWASCGTVVTQKGVQSGTISLVAAQGESLVPLCTEFSVQVNFVEHEHGEPATRNLFQVLCRETILCFHSQV
jgi:hypothetical protein